MKLISLQCRHARREVRRPAGVSQDVSGPALAWVSVAVTGHGGSYAVAHARVGGVAVEVPETSREIGARIRFPRLSPVDFPLTDFAGGEYCRHVKGPAT